MLKLNMEMKALWKWLSLSKEEIRLRKGIVEELKSIIGACLTDAHFETVGSLMSGMYLLLRRMICVGRFRTVI